MTYLNKSVLTFLVLSILILFQSQAYATDDIQLRLAVADQGLLIYVQNDGPKTVVFDPVFQDGSKEFQLTIKNDQGETPDVVIMVNPATFNIERLVTLHPGDIAGRRIKINDFKNNYLLESGNYSISALYKGSRSSIKGIFYGTLVSNQLIFKIE